MLCNAAYSEKTTTTKSVTPNCKMIYFHCNCTTISGTMKYFAFWSIQEITDRNRYFYRLCKLLCSYVGTQVPLKILKVYIIRSSFTDGCLIFQATCHFLYMSTKGLLFSCKTNPQVTSGTRKLGFHRSAYKPFLLTENKDFKSRHYQQ